MPTAVAVLKSALVVKGNNAHDYSLHFIYLMNEVEAVSALIGIHCRVLLQHSLKEDRMAIMVEAGNKTMAGVGSSFQDAVEKAINEMRSYRREYAAQQEEERPSGKKGSKGRGRESAAGKRSTSVLQRRRSRSR